jgi:formylglycine-generating enzyme required for sulfatase activity
MLPEKYRWISVQFEPEGNPELLYQIARELAGEGNLEGAATVLDRAYGIAPEIAEISQARRQILDRLAVKEQGIVFRYVPGGPFVMGCHDREPDERPWHPVWLSPFWLSETPISWATYCRLMDWEPPTAGHPRTREGQQIEPDERMWRINGANRIRMQYCEDGTTYATDWHSHIPPNLRARTGHDFGVPPRVDPDAPWSYEAKPMIAVAWQDAEELADHLSTGEARCTLPTEAQWEKAARGGLIGARHAWGDAPPNHDNCDFDRFYECSILPMKTFPPNGYGLYAMCGGVWEWTRDWYVRDYFPLSPDTDPEGPPDGEEKVLRGGSWADCSDAVTVRFRMSRGSTTWRERWAPQMVPNIGFRLCRIVPNLEP